MLDEEWLKFIKEGTTNLTLLFATCYLFFCHRCHGVLQMKRMLLMIMLCEKMGIEK